MRRLVLLLGLLVPLLAAAGCSSTPDAPLSRRVPIDHTGPYTTWWSDDVVREEGEYLEGERHGFVRGFNPDGTLSFEGRFEHGLPMGQMITRYPGGGVKVAESMKGGRREGVRIEYDESGRPRAEEVWADNVRHGHALAWHANGVPASEGRYERGLPAGVWRTWDEQGVLQATTHHWVADGAAVGQLETTWRPDGSVATQTLMTRRDGAWTGWATAWHPNGRQASLTGFLDDRRHGRDVTWNEAGRMTNEGRWVEDRRDGVWSHWDASGALVRRVEYAQGEVISEG